MAYGIVRRPGPPYLKILKGTLMSNWFDDSVAAGRLMVPVGATPVQREGMRADWHGYVSRGAPYDRAQARVQGYGMAYAVASIGHACRRRSTGPVDRALG